MTKTLNEINEGLTARISHIDCGRNLCRRLSELGMFTGSEITIIKNPGRGPLIIQIFESRFAIGRGQAEKIHVEEDL